MPGKNGDGLTFECQPNKGGVTATITAKLAGEVLAVESFNLSKGKARQSFAATLAKGRPGIDVAAVEGELLELAADLASKPEPSADPASLSEIDTSRIVRPERFITPEVSGLAVPTMTIVGEKVVGRWQLHLQWSDGKRERRTLRPSIDLPGGGRLYVHPEPTEPTPNTKPGWSAEARKRWLSGEPAPDPAAVFQGVCRRIAYFLDLPKPEAPGVTATLAIWVIHSYVYQAWPAVPYLYIGGPLESGKTRVFDILSRTVWRPLGTSNVTAPSLFRTLNERGGTCLLDEAERLKDARSPDVAELLSALLAGNKKGGAATRLEPVGDSGFRTVNFDVFGPKALACISGLPPALASRCIPVTMFRAPPGSEKPKRRIDSDPSGWQRLRDDLHAVALEHGATWLRLADRDEVCPAMSGRDFELWQPLLALASWIEEAGAHGLLKLLQTHAVATIDAGKDDRTPCHDETVLRILAEAVRCGERPTPGDILDKAKEAEPEVFKRWSARAVAAHLKRYRLATLKTAGQKRYSRVTLDDLRRIETNYSIDLGLQTE